MRGSVKVARFAQLTSLEVKKLPIHMLEGLSRLRGQLHDITALHSIEEVKVRSVGSQSLIVIFFTINFL